MFALRLITSLFFLMIEGNQVILKNLKMCAIPYHVFDRVCLNFDLLAKYRIASDYQTPRKIAHSKKVY